MEYKIRRADELYHYGVLGMKWGRRRYQNKDGTLTAAGKRRLEKESATLEKEEQVMKNRKDTKAQIDQLAARRKALDEDRKELEKDPNKPVKKTMKDMSNEELKAAVTRAQQEWQYLDYNKKINDIKEQERERKRNSPARKFLVKALHEIADKPISNAAKGAFEKGLKEAMGLGKNNNNQQNQSAGKKNKNKQNNQSSKNKKKDVFEWDEVTGALKEIAKEERSDINEIATFIKDANTIITENQRKYREGR